MYTPLNDISIPILSRQSYLKPPSDITCKVNGLIGDRNFNYVGKLAHVHRLCDMAHAQWLQTQCQWKPMADVKVITQERIGV